MGRTGHESATLIVDVEGTDSKERGENRKTFEHRASLFSLAIADMVIVNMWYNVCISVAFVIPACAGYWPIRS